MTCVSCHALHAPEDDPRPLRTWADDQLAPGMRGDAACTGCHPAFARPEAIAAHTHHAPGSTGSGCYDCHMPNTAYGLLKLTRNHQLESPSAAVTVATGRPNACNLCHLDRPLAWAAAHLEAWYGQPSPALDDEAREVASGALLALRGDAHQRAIAAWHMGWEPALEAAGARAGQGGDWMAPVLARLLVDPYAAVRFIAGRSLAARPAFADLGYDFVASEAEREAARAEALARWRGLPREVPPDPAAVLLDEAGEPREDRVRHLLARRDDRRVALAE